MITYRFNRKWVRAFATETEAFEHSLCYDDNFQATVERDLGHGWELFVETYDGNGKWVADPRDEQFRAQLQHEAENAMGGIAYQPSVAEYHRRKIAKADANMPDAMLGVMDSSGEASALRRLQNKNGNYRGWNVYRMATGYGIRKQGWQGYANFKTVQAAMAKIDAIVG